jgi:hypothetical protein
MKNVTITLEDDVAGWARVQAAERNTSVFPAGGRALTPTYESRASL